MPHITTDDGIKLYLRRNGDTVAGKKVQVIVRNVPGPAPEVAKRLAQELVTQDGVDILAGFGLTPNALAAAAIATEAITQLPESNLVIPVPLTW